MIAPMGAAPAVEALPWTCTPLEVLAAWPPGAPVFLLHSARFHPRWARWSIVACPSLSFRFDGRPCWNEWPGAARPPRVDLGGAPPADLDAILGATRRVQASGATAFTGGWIGFLSYELGAVLEPAATRRRPKRAERHAWPILELAWCPRTFFYDHASGTWSACGEGPPPDLEAGRAPLGFRAGALRGLIEPDRYLDMVSRAIEYIGAGDIFQANVSHRLRADFSGSTRALAARALACSGAWYGAYMEFPGGRALLSLSPELFLRVRPAAGAGPGDPLGGASVVTRPVKGTRPSRLPRRDLLDSPKDAAELNMIVDLMRNDLGRVCAYGSVRVPQPRTVETHPTVHHGVAEVTGRLRPGTTAGDLIAATFPAGSITGAPKIRAMQIIDELEPLPRGPYCGAIGRFGDDGRIDLSVAIRTIVLTGRRTAGRWDRLEGVLEYGAGGGIVADSEPLSEYRETLDKAAILRRVLAGAMGQRS